MTRAIPRTTHFHSSHLLRCLAELDLLDAAEPAGDFADGLGQWMPFTNAIALASVHERGMTDFPAQSPAVQEETRARLAAQMAHIGQYLEGSITRSCTPAAKTAIKLPLPDPELSYAPYKRFYEAHQRDMELSIEPLRVNLRAALAKASPALRKLAELDIVMDKFLRPREAQLLARVPQLLQKRFAAEHAAHQAQVAASASEDDVNGWMRPGGWLFRFCQTMQTVLLAEADLRLQPSVGLLAALNQIKHNE
jgi:hypothetical protein